MDRTRECKGNISFSQNEKDRQIDKQIEDRQIDRQKIHRKADRQIDIQTEGQGDISLL